MPKPLHALLCTTLMILMTGCNAHGFGGKAHLRMSNDRPLDGQGRKVSHKTNLAWNFVHIREWHRWVKGDLSVDMIAAVAQFEAASPSVSGTDPDNPEYSLSNERRTIVCVDPLVAICIAEERSVATRSGLSTTPIAFFQYGFGTLTLPLGYDAGTKFTITGPATWLVLDGEQAHRSAAVDQAGELSSLVLPNLILKLCPTGGDTYKVIGEPTQTASTITP